MEPLSILAGLTIGMHIATVHIPHRDYQNDINPGMYVQHTETGLTVGAYHNTLRRTSVYVAKVFNTGKLFGMQTNVMLGGITGYKRIETYVYHSSLSINPSIHQSIHPPKNIYLQSNHL